MQIRVDGLAWIKKSDLSYSQLRQLKKELTVVPRKIGDHPGEPPGPLYLYEETVDEIGIARSYFQKRKKPHHTIEWDVTKGKMSQYHGPVKFAGQLRAEQQQALDEVKRKFEAGRLGGMVRAVTGWGKTVHACAVMAAMEVPTLVIVHKEFLMNQWKERIAQFLPDAKIGTIQQNVCEYDGRTVAVAMVHSLASKDYEGLWDWPGLIIVDECHRIGASTWSVVPQKFNAKWRLGYSATPRRKDGADDVFYNHLGDILFVAKEKRLKPKIKRVWTGFKLYKTDTFNPNLIKRPTLIKIMCGSKRRNRMIVEQIIAAVQAGRKLLVLSERLKHLDEMAALLEGMWPNNSGAVPTMGFYVGGRKQEELKAAAQAKVVFATKQLASEGLDIPPLDTLLLTTPMSDVEQAVGRILRPSPDKKEPIVVDFRDDDIRACAKTAEYRDKFYDQF